MEYAVKYAVKFKSRIHLIINSIIIAIFYIIPLLILSPYLDNFFGAIDKTKHFTYIILEVICHLLALVFFYNIINGPIAWLISIYYKLVGKNNNLNPIQQNILANFISSIILVGSQKHLINRISFLTDMILNKEVNYLSSIRNEITKYF